MGWISNVLTGGTGSVIQQVGDVIDEFHLSGEEKQKFKLEMESLLQKRDSEIEQTLRQELESKEKIIVAELQQGDNYTKRARPTVVYVGLFFIFFNYCFIPLLATIFSFKMTPFDLPAGFWAGWSGVVGAWSIGRTFEKRGAHNKFSRLATGTPSSKIFDDDDVKG